MTAILKFDFKKRQSYFSEEIYLHYTNKTQFCIPHFSNKVKQDQAVDPLLCI